MASFAMSDAQETRGSRLPNGEREGKQIFELSNDPHWRGQKIDEEEIANYYEDKGNQDVVQRFRSWESGDYVWEQQHHHESVLDYHLACPRTFRALARVFCLLTVGLPLVALLILYILSLAKAGGKDSHFSLASNVGILTPIIFGLLTFGASAPYLCLIAFWLPTTRPRVLFWMIHVCLFAFPLAMLYPISQDMITKDDSNNGVMKGIVLSTVVFGVVSQLWLFLLNISLFFYQMAVQLQLLISVLALGVVALPGVLLFAAAIHNDTFGAKLLGSAGPYKSSSVSYGSGVLLTLVLGGILTLVWIYKSITWWDKNTLSRFVIAANFVLVATVVAPLGGILVAGQVYPGLSQAMGQDSVEICAILEIQGLLLICGGFLSRLTLLVEEANTAIRVLVLFLYFVLVVIPTPFLMPFKVLSEFQSSGHFSGLAIASITGLLVSLWMSVVYSHLMSVRNAFWLEYASRVDDSDNTEYEQDDSNMIVDEAGQFDRSVSYSNEQIIAQGKVFVHEVVRAVFLRLWLLPTIIYLTFVCPSVPSIIVMAIDSVFRNSFADVGAGFKAFVGMLVAGFELLIWLGWHGPVFKLPSRVGNQRSFSFCRLGLSDPKLLNKLDIAKSVLFLSLLFLPSMVLCSWPEVDTIRSTCIGFILGGALVLFWLEVYFSRQASFWVSERERKIISIIFLGCFAPSSCLLLPNSIEKLHLLVMRNREMSHQSLYLSKGSEDAIQVSLLLSIFSIGYMLLYHIRMQNIARKWFCRCQTVLFCILAVSLSLLLTKWCLGSILPFAIFSFSSIASLLGLGWIYFLEVYLLDELPLLDIRSLSVAVVATVITPISLMPGMWASESASGLNAAFVILILGIGVLLWIGAAVHFYIPQHIPDASRRLKAGLIYEVFTVAPVSVLFLLVQENNYMGYGIVLVLELLGPSIFLIFLLDKRYVASSEAFSSRAARVGVAFLIISGFVLPVLLLVNAWIWPNFWDFQDIPASPGIENDSNTTGILIVSRGYHSLTTEAYGFLIGVSLFILSYLFAHERLLKTYGTPTASAGLCAGTVLSNIIVFSFYSSINDEQMPFSELKELCRSILVLTPLFILGAIGFVHSRFRLVDKFSVVVAVFVILPLLILLGSISISSGKWFLVYAVPCGGMFWFFLSVVEQSDMHKNLLKAWSWSCFSILIPLGVLMPLILSWPSEANSMGLVRNTDINASIIEVVPQVGDQPRNSLFILAVLLPSLGASFAVFREIKRCQAIANREKMTSSLHACIYTVKLSAQRCSQFCFSPTGAYWMNHICLSLFMVAVIVFIREAALPHAKPALWVVFVFAPTIYIIGMSQFPSYQEEYLERRQMEKKTQRSRLLGVVMVGAILSTLIGIALFATRGLFDSETTASMMAGSGLVFLLIIPGMILIWAFLWLFKFAVKSLPSEQSVNYVAIATSMCCFFVMLPIGVTLFILSIDWWTTHNVLVVTISLMALLALADVATSTIVINRTFQSIRHERLAKQTSIAIVKALSQIHCKISVQTARMVFDKIGTSTLSTMKETLAAEPTSSKCLITSLLEENGTTILPHQKFIEKVTLGRIVLCKRCFPGGGDCFLKAQANSDSFNRSLLSNCQNGSHAQSLIDYKFVRAAKKNTLCQACMLDDTVSEKKLQLEAKRMAEKGDRALAEKLRQERLQAREELRARRREESRSYKAGIKAFDDGNWRDAIIMFGKAIDLSDDLADVKYYRRRGIAYLKLATNQASNLTGSQSIRRNRRLSERDSIQSLKPLDNIESNYIHALRDGEFCEHLNDAVASFIIRGGALVGLSRFNEAMRVYSEGVSQYPTNDLLRQGLVTAVKYAKVLNTPIPSQLIQNAQNSESIGLALKSESSSPSTLKQFLSRVASSLCSAIRLQSSKWKIQVDASLDDLRITPVHRLNSRNAKDKIKATKLDMTSQRQNMCIFNGRRTQSTIEKVRQYHKRQISRAHRNTHVIFRMQIIDATICATINSHKRGQQGTEAPRIFVKASLQFNHLKRFKKTKIARSFSPVWADEVFFIRRWMAPPKAQVDITLCEARRQKGKSDIIRVLGKTSLYMFQIARYCRQNFYGRFNLKKVGPRRAHSGKPSPEENIGINHSVGLAFTHAKSASALGILALSSSKADKVLRRCFYAWRRLSGSEGERISRCLDEIFVYYVKIIEDERRERERRRDKQRSIIMRKTFQERLSQIRSENQTMSSRPEFQDGLYIYRMHTSQIEMLRMGLPSFQRMAEDCKLDNLHPQRIFLNLQHQRASKGTGVSTRQGLSRDEFIHSIHLLASLRWPRVSAKVAFIELVHKHLMNAPPYIARRTRAMHQRNSHTQHTYSTTQKFVSQNPAEVQRNTHMNLYARSCSALAIQRWWREMKLRNEAAVLLTRWGRRQAKRIADLPIRKLNKQLQDLLSGSLDDDRKSVREMALQESRLHKAIEDDLNRQPSCLERIFSLSLGKSIGVNDSEKQEAGAKDDNDTLQPVRRFSSEQFKVVFAMGLALEKFEKAAKNKAKILRSKHRPWGKIQEVFLSVLEKNAKIGDLPTHDSEGRRRDIAVDWMNFDNRLTFVAVVVSTLWQYSSVAITNGPLEDRANATKASFSNTSQTWRQELVQQDMGWIPFVLDCLFWLPQFQLPNVYGQTFFYFFAFAAIISLTYPIFAIRAVQQVREGTFGFDHRGKPNRLCSRDGCANAFLTITNDFLFFGIMITLLSAFSCKHILIPLAATNVSTPGPEYKFYLIVSEGTTCFSLHEPAQLILMLIASVCLLCFYPLATLLAPNFQFANRQLDLKYSQGFLILEHQADLLLAGLEVFISEINAETVLCLQIAICIGMAIVSHKTKPCLVYRLNLIKTSLYTFCAWISLCVLIFRTIKRHEYEPSLESWLSLSSTVCVVLISLGLLLFPSATYLYYSRVLVKSVHIPELKRKPHGGERPGCLRACCTLGCCGSNKSGTEKLTAVLPRVQQKSSKAESKSLDIAQNVKTK